MRKRGEGRFDPTCPFYFETVNKGSEINFKRFCFPSDGTTPVDILNKMLDIPS